MKEGWTTKRLGDVCEIIKGRKPTLRNSPSNGDLPYLVAKVMRGTARPQYASLKDRNAVAVEESETIIICDGSSSGEVFTGFRGVLSSTMGKISKKVSIDDEYLRAFLGSTFEVFNGAKTGAAIPHLDKDAMYRLAVPLPPLDEQQRIVRILDHAFEGIATAKANAERNLANAQALFEGHLQSVFTQRDSSHEMHQLRDVCEEITVGHVGPMATQYRATGIPFLRSQNIRPFRVVLDNLVFIDKRFHRALAKSSLRPGDVVIVRTGYPGTAAVIPETLTECNCSDLVIARPGKEVDPHYLALFFNSDHGKRLVAGRLVGAAQKHFNVTAAKQVGISLPSISEQRRIAARLNTFRAETQRLASLYQRKLSALEALKRSFLHQAFCGDL